MSLYSEVKFGKEASDLMFEGVNVLADAVASTLGAKGRNVAIAKSTPQGEIWERTVVHDGVTVAKHIALKDEFMDMGAQLIKEAAQKQVQDVGDGTTVSVILARAILAEYRLLTTAGVNPMQLRRSIEKQIDFLTREITKRTVPIKTDKQLQQIATISAADIELGELVSKTISQMGVGGLIHTEESKSATTTVDRQVGMQIDKGYIHALFMTNLERNEAIIEDALILTTDRPINTLEPLRELLEWLVKEQRKLVIFTPHMGQDALSAMLQNKMNGILPSLVIPAPSFGVNQKNTLQDIAFFTGGKFISEDAGDKFESVAPGDLGHAHSVTATKSGSIIVGGRGKKKDIDDRIASIQKDIELEENEFDRDKMRERLARLTTGVAIIRVGGTTEVEMKERVERVKDAVLATQAAQKSGVVPGGEIIFLSIREDMRSQKLKQKEDQLAVDLLYAALYEPFRILLANAGLNDGMWYERIRSQSVGQLLGVDVMTEEMVDMIDSGIIDPSLVPINALKNASSVAIQIATTGTVVVQHSDQKK